MSTILIAGSVVMAIYGRVNWVGNQTWKSYLEYASISPEELSLRTYLPKPLPDDENFAAAPVVKRWFIAKSQNDPFNSDHFAKVRPSLVDHILNVEKMRSLRLVELEEWQTEFLKGAKNSLPSISDEKAGTPSRQLAAASVLTALQDDNAVIQALRAASVRSRFFYPVNYMLNDPWNTLLPHDFNIGSLSLRLELKACAELAKGDNVKAFDDVMLTLYLADSLTNEPLIISFLVRTRCIHAAVQPLWEGIAEHQWSDSQLHQLETQLLRVNLPRELGTPLKTERAQGIMTIDLTKRNGIGYLAQIASGGKPSILSTGIGQLIDCFIPSGWFALEKYHFCRSFDTLFTNTFDPIEGTISLFRSDANLEAFNRDVGAGGKSPMDVILHHRTVARLLLTKLPHCLFRAAIAQTAANQAALACAIERYRLGNGTYPTSLQQLVPDWMPTMPHDVIGGQPYHYHLTDVNHFVLYSVGWDAKDDGGNAGESLFAREGDWVWKNECVPSVRLCDRFAPRRLVSCNTLYFAY